jgi:sterol desaturase/sphingolipid hydroxylase (fatty acid hydroxylase superfamily)
MNPVHTLTALAMVTLVALEWRDPVFRADSVAPGPRRRRNWAFLVASALPMVVVGAVTAWLQRHLPSLLTPGNLPLALDFVACTLAAELVSWLLHRVKHAHPYLWRFHFQHHRETHFSVWMVTHTHALEVTLSGVMLVALLAGIGFSALAVQLYFAFYSVVLAYHHSARGHSLGWLDRVIVSPAYHRLHHRPDARCNYGGALTVWDVVFGTATWPDPATRDVEVGLSPHAPEPFGFRAEMLHFLSGWRGQRP